MIETLFPYIASILLTVAYAGVGKLSSGESFDINKFSQTMGVQASALILFAATSYAANIDLAVFTATLPPLITAFIMKLYSYIKKKRKAE
jgi:hypothetical protein